MLIANGTASNSMRLSAQNATGTGNAALVFESWNLEYGRFDTSGRLLVGTSTSRGSSCLELIEGVDGGSTKPGLEIISNYTNATADGEPIVALTRSGSTAIGSTVAVVNGNKLGQIYFRGTDGTNIVNAASIAAFVDGTPGTNDMPGRLVFSTTADGAASPTERMRITSGGFLKASPTGVYNDSTGGYHELVGNTNGTHIAVVRHNNTDPSGIVIAHITDKNNTANNFLRCLADASFATLRAEIRTNGGLANYQANNVNLSDINTKKDISPAADTWSCLKEWEIVNYRYKDQPDDADLNLGVIAQQVAESCPEVITIFQEAKEATDDAPAQEERLGVKEQQMYWMAIKALQEAQVRIEQLEAKVAALESA
jgi:hypothetical protein